MDREEYVAKLTDQIAEIEEDMTWMRIHESRSGQTPRVGPQLSSTASSEPYQNERLLDLLKEGLRMATENDE